VDTLACLYQWHRKRGGGGGGEENGGGGAPPRVVGVGGERAGEGRERWGRELGELQSLQLFVWKGLAPANVHAQSHLLGYSI